MDHGGNHSNNMCQSVGAICIVDVGQSPIIGSSDFSFLLP